MGFAVDGERNRHTEHLPTLRGRCLRLSFSFSVPGRCDRWVDLWRKNSTVSRPDEAPVVWRSISARPLELERSRTPRRAVTDVWSRAIGASSDTQQGPVLAGSGNPATRSMRMTGTRQLRRGVAATPATPRQRPPSAGTHSMTTITRPAIGPARISWSSNASRQFATTEPARCDGRLTSSPRRSTLDRGPGPHPIAAAAPGPSVRPAPCGYLVMLCWNIRWVRASTSSQVEVH
jgi:hypothetical protein